MKNTFAVLAVCKNNRCFKEICFADLENRLDDVEIKSNIVIHSMFDTRNVVDNYFVLIEYFIMFAA